jgi:hypothetical protein
MENVFRFVGTFAVLLLCGAIGCMFVYDTTNISDIPQTARGAVVIASASVALGVVMINYLDS